MLNEKKVSRYSPCSESAIFIFGWVLVYVGSSVNKATADFYADINRELIRKK